MNYVLDPHPESQHHALWTQTLTTRFEWLQGEMRQSVLIALQVVTLMLRMALVIETCVESCRGGQLNGQGYHSQHSHSRLERRSRP